MAETNETRGDDIPLNKTLLMGTLVIAGAFGFFQLTSCTRAWVSTPAYVQALQACKDVGRYPVEIKRGETRSEEEIVTVQISPEILATIEKCHEVVRSNYSEKVDSGLMGIFDAQGKN